MKQINSSMFAKRRQTFLNRLPKNSIAILPAASEKLRNADTHYLYRQDSDFYYLTGFNEPHAIAVFIPQRKPGEYILFCRSHNIEEECWEGKRAGLEGAIEHYLADEAFSIKNIEEKLPDFIADYETLYYSFGQNKEFDQQMMDWIKIGRQRKRKAYALKQIIAVGEILHEQRLIKTVDEIDCMRKAVDISVEAHLQAMRICEPDMWEYQIEAEMMYTFLRHGCHTPAYPSIIASGINACTLHYVENNALLNDGDLLLIDAAAEHENYAADITRTFPVNGRFNNEQAAIYDLVLAAQQAALKQIKPGLIFNKIQQAIVEVITQGLLDLNILQGKYAELLERQAYQSVYIHNSGHWLGLDVHDVGQYQINGQSRPLETGMVLTVEPGIYIAPHLNFIDPKWHGIGVRIEDDVLITAVGHEVLSAQLPKTREDIEHFMQQG